MINAENQAAPSPRVVIGANDAATLAGIRMALGSDGVEVCAEAHSLEELVEAVGRCQPDVCLIDADVAGGGIRAAADIRSQAPDVSIVLLAGDASHEDFLEAIRVGASGYVPKRIAPARLASVIRAVIKGEPAIPRALVTLLIDQYRARPPRRQLHVAEGGRGVDLTSREWEVLDLMRERLSTREIADRLCISEVTVRRHIGSLLKKLQVSSRAEVLRLLETA
jgi:DNA-binding NarL/FixJ family response regulator